MVYDPNMLNVLLMELVVLNEHTGVSLHKYQNSL